MPKMLDEQMQAKLAEFPHLMKEYAKALAHADNQATESAMMKTIDTMTDEFAAQVLGLPDEEIARINRESEAAVDEQFAAESTTGAPWRGP